MSNSTLVIIPTYNEVENLPLITRRVIEAAPDVDVLVVDDNSPDGTGKLADDLAAEHDTIHVLHRTAKDGLMAAYRAGFRWALERDYQVICQMDADGSHAPEELARLLEAIENGADLVIGSRYVDGGEVTNWPQQRYLLSKLGNRYISAALGEDVNDLTAGYRAFRREVLEQLDLNELSPKGFIFQAEVAHKAGQAGFDVREVPITFEDRTLGESKLNASFAATSLAEVTKWGVAEKTTSAANLLKEVGALAQYEFERSALSRTGERLGSAAEKAATTVGEMYKLAKYEMKKSPLAKAPKNAANLVGDGVAAVGEFTNLAKHELKRATTGR